MQDRVGRYAEAVILLSRSDLYDLHLLIRRLNDHLTSGELWLDAPTLALWASTLERWQDNVSTTPFSGCRASWIYP